MIKCGGAKVLYMSPEINWRGETWEGPGDGNS